MKKIILKNIHSIPPCLKPVPNKNIEGWESEFERRYEKLPTYMAEVDKFFVENPDTFYGKEVYLESILEIDMGKVRTFIRNLLSAQRSNLVKDIEGIQQYDYDGHLNKCIMVKDLLNLINNSK